MIFSWLLLCFATFFNSNKQFFNSYEIGYWVNNNIHKISRFKDKDSGFTYPGRYVFNWLFFVRDRKNYFNYIMFRSDVLNKYEKIIKHNSRILILAEGGRIFPFILYRADLKKTISAPDHIYNIQGKLWNIDNPENYRLLRNKFDYVLYIGKNTNESISAEKLIFHYPKVGNERDTEFSLYKLAY
jgi:hypothetical protein